MENKKIDRLINHIVKKNLDIQIGTDIEGKTCFIADWNMYDRIESYLNRLEYNNYPVAIMWDDNFRYCEHCNRYFDSMPGYYGDQSCMSVWLSDYEYLCADCAKEFIREVIDHYKNNYKMVIPTKLVEDIKKEGFVCFGVDNNSCMIFETGLHEDQDDKPETVIKQLDKQGILNDYDYIFALKDVGQFDIYFTLFLRPKF